ncbi:MAG TPA: hypothetical protein VMG35_12300 [Bryobacteraceae bacterium]|nr:hypothetical protein [Bryobacteraceae bacterium]
MSETSAALEVLAARLRSLAAEGRYAEAQLAFEDYCRALQENLAGLPPGDPRWRRLEAGWRRLLDETRRLVLAGRAHAGVRLARLPRAAPRYGDAPRPRRTWEYSG